MSIVNVMVGAGGAMRPSISAPHLAPPQFSERVSVPGRREKMLDTIACRCQCHCCYGLDRCTVSVTVVCCVASAARPSSVRRSAPPPARLATWKLKDVTGEVTSSAPQAHVTLSRAHVINSSSHFHKFNLRASRLPTPITTKSDNIIRIMTKNDTRI